MADTPDPTRGPRRARFAERVDARASVMTSARHAARSAFASERLRSSPIGRDSNHQDTPNRKYVFPMFAFYDSAPSEITALQSLFSSLLPHFKINSPPPLRPFPPCSYLLNPGQLLHRSSARRSSHSSLPSPSPSSKLPTRRVHLTSVSLSSLFSQHRPPSPLLLLLLARALVVP